MIRGTIHTMSGTTRGTNGTGPGPVPTGPMSTKEAAIYLGISDRAVRKRISAGTLMGEQIDGQWMVYPHAVRQSGTFRNAAQGRRAEEPRPRAEEPYAEPGTAVAVMEKIVSPLVAHIAAQTTQLGDLREQLGRERTLREIAEARTAEFERQLAGRVAPQTEPEPAELGPRPVPPFVLRAVRYILTGRS